MTLVREAMPSTRLGARQVEPHDAHLVVRGDRLWLRMLVAEILALNGGGVAAPAVKFETGACRNAVRFAWSEFCAARTGALQVALIEMIARAQGADVIMHADGLSLLWPLERLDRRSG
jgi:hypothetical protein